MAKRKAQQANDLEDVRLRLTFSDLPETEAPSHPERLQARLDGPRRRKVHAIFRDLNAKHAKVRCHRRRSDRHVEQLHHVIWWLLDAVELVPPPLADDGKPDHERN